MIRHSKTPLPRLWHTHPKAIASDILGEAEIKISRHSRLRAKLLVFKNNKAMRRFFKDVLEKPYVVCPKTLGICCSLSVICENAITGKQIWEGDPRYFCMIGLLHEHLRMEIITHESVHGGFAYAARQNQKQWVKGDALDEEEVCYPAGIIASQINVFLDREGLYQR
jgi:hypothetical protein